VLVPEAAGVLSALGLAASDERRDRVQSHLVPLTEAGELPVEGKADLRYVGQSFELTVPLGRGGDVAEAFHRAHEERYGYVDRDRAIELVAVRTAKVRPGPKIQPSRSSPKEVAGPSVLELDGSTCWLPVGWVGVRDGATWRLTRT
jgi:N-methylhydantoinase A